MNAFLDAKVLYTQNRVPKTRKGKDKYKEPPPGAAQASGSL